MKRNLLIDTIRGLLLVLMLIDHTPLFIKKYTLEPIGFVSAAEGFIFISAYLFGLIYSKYLSTPGFFIKKTLKRVWVIYKYHIAAIIVIHLLIFIVNNYISPGALNVIKYGIEEPSVGYFLKAFLLLKQPWTLDVLPLYIILIAISPFILLGFKYNFKITLLFSFILWLVIQFPYAQELYNNFLIISNIDLGFFNVIGWQFLFTLGLFLGYQKNQNKNLIKYKPITVYFISIVLLAFFVTKRILPSYNIELYRLMIGYKENLQPIRLINFILLVYIVGFFNKKFIITEMNFLSYIGRYSIDVFTFHLLLIYILDFISADISTLSRPIQLILAVLIVSLLLLPAIIKEEVSSKSNSYNRQRILSRLTLVALIPADFLKMIKNSTSYIHIQYKQFFLKTLFKKPLTKYEWEKIRKF